MVPKKKKQQLFYGEHHDQPSDFCMFLCDADDCGQFTSTPRIFVGYQVENLILVPQTSVFTRMTATLNTNSGFFFACGSLIAEGTT